MHRYYHAGKTVSMSAIVNGKWMSTGQIYLFLQLVETACRNYPGSQLIMCEDVGEPWRNEIFPDYKKGRPEGEDVFHLRKDLETLMGMSGRVGHMRQEGMEADDLLAKLFFQCKDDGEEVVVFSGDNDMLQLIPFGATVSRVIGRGQFVPIDQEYIAEKFGCPIELLLRYRIMIGDSSDGISGLWPRMNRAKVLDFCRVWREKSISHAVAEFPDRDFAQRVIDNYHILERNKMLMQLVHYSVPEKRGPRLEPEFLSVEGGEDVIERYKLGKYARFLRFINEDTSSAV